MQVEAGHRKKDGNNSADIWCDQIFLDDQE